MLNMRSNYWTCSTFAKWLRSRVGVESPRSATSQGWKIWKDDYKSSHPIMYFITEKLLGNLQDIIYKPKDIYHEISCYYDNRFVSKIHYLPTNLKVGKYYDIDTRLLHGLFGTLVEFVESELANHRCAWHDLPTISKKNKEALGREYGLASLAWQMELMEDDETTPTPQAVYARELHDLYIWWKDTRPSRLDPMDASGYNALINNSGKDILDLLGDISPERTKAGQLMHDIEEYYNKEDEEMMIRLIKIRQSMWT